MGKASRRLRKAEQSANPKVIAAPFIARPFEGLPGETDWVAMREIVPAATARVKLRDVEAVQAARAAGGQGASGASVANEATEVTIVTILPNAWPGLHRDGGELVVAMQSHTTTGDPSRDVAAVILALLASPAGVPLTSVRQADASTPRLQDILDLDAQFEAEVHDSFAFWVSDVNALDAQTKAELADADESII
ncbi:MAG: DUF5926 family protein, partial [Dermatophilus congolensis]|nr:DUF5926 family protein [Dermatophilus congolensis]